MYKTNKIEIFEFCSVFCINWFKIYKVINAFIQQGCIQFKSERKYIYFVTRDSHFSNKCYSPELSMH